MRTLPIISQAKFAEMTRTLTLDLPTEPYWLDLPRGVRVEIRPITTAVMAAAQAAASCRLGAARAEDPDLDPEGLAFARERSLAGSPALAARRR